MLLTLGDKPTEVVIRVHPARQLAGRVVKVGSDESCELSVSTLLDVGGAKVDVHSDWSLPRRGCVDSVSPLLDRVRGRLRQAVDKHTYPAVNVIET